VGILVNLVCEQVALYIISTTRVTVENNFCPNHSALSMTQQLVKDSNASDESNTTSDKSSQLDSATSARSHSQSSRQLSVNSRMDCCEVGAVVAVFANANDPRALLKAYVLEGAIAVHSIIMGVSLGSMQKDELANIKILMIAYAVHQFLEGISLG
jgi:hypothetical protein